MHTYYSGKHHVDNYIRQIGLPATFVFTGNFYENWVFRGHMHYDKEKDVVEFRQPIVLPQSKHMPPWFRFDSFLSNRLIWHITSRRIFGHRQGDFRQLEVEARAAPACVSVCL